ncbi:hypothetical protein [Rhizobium mesoamericanum]|uniref:hypothetical protein n=1 Tax=Rhizobium mesoamericanum TaxID=1079800 RepID=UPI0003182452|nr:hypothetical protein [Rhizobium mesoamericanum]
MFGREPELAARVQARLETALDRAGAILRTRGPVFNALATFNSTKWRAGKTATRVLL